MIGNSAQQMCSYQTMQQQSKLAGVDNEVGHPLPTMRDIQINQLESIGISNSIADHVLNTLRGSQPEPAETKPSQEVTVLSTAEQVLRMQNALLSKLHEISSLL